MNLTINYDLLVFFYRMTFSEPPRHQLLVFWMKMLGPRFEFKKNLPGIVLPTNWPKGPCRNKENRGKTRRRTMQSKVDGDKIDIAHLAYNKTLEVICKRHSLKAFSKYFGYIAIHTTTLNWSLPYWSVISRGSRIRLAKHFGDARSAWKPWAWRRRRALRRLDQLLLRWHPKSHRWRPLDSRSLGKFRNETGRKLGIWKGK